MVRDENKNNLSIHYYKYNLLRIRLYWQVKPMKFAWIMAEGKIWDVKKQFITTALESGIEYIVDFTDTERIKKLGNLSIVSDTSDVRHYHGWKKQ